MSADTSPMHCLDQIFYLTPINNIHFFIIIINVKALEVKVDHLSISLQQIKDTQVRHGKKTKALKDSSQFNEERLSTAEVNIVKTKHVSKEYTDAGRKYFTLSGNLQQV